MRKLFFKSSSRITGLVITKFKFLIVLFLQSLFCTTLVMAENSVETQPIDHESLTRTFHELREIKGHFEGGSWNDDIDKWQGTQHRTMQALARFITPNKSTEQEILSLFGPADEYILETHHKFLTLLEQVGWPHRPHGKILIYYWRGKHDQLMMLVNNGMVEKISWLYSWE